MASLPIGEFVKAMEDAADACSTPSRARLAQDLAVRSYVLRVRAAVDFTLIEALLRMGRPAAACRAVEAHRRALEAYARDVVTLIEGATAERDAGGASPNVLAQVRAGMAAVRAAADGDGDVAAQLEHLHDTLSRIPRTALDGPQLDEVDRLLTAEQRLLDCLAGHHPHVSLLVNELRALRARFRLPQQNGSQHSGHR